MKKIPVRSAARRNGSKPRSVKQTSFFSSLDAAMQRGWALGDMYDRSGAPEIVRVRRTRHEEGAATIEPRETKQPVAAEPSAPAPASANTANQSSTAIAAAAPKPTAPRGTLVSSQSKTVKRVPTAAPAAVHKRAKNHRRAVGAAMAGIVSSVFTKPTAALHAGGKAAVSRARELTAASFSTAGVPLYLTARTDRYKLDGSRATRRVYARSKVVMPSVMALNLVLAVFLLYGLTATSFFKSRHHAPQTAVNGSSEAGGENAATASSDAKTSSKTGSMTQPASPAEAQSQTSGAQADTAATATGTHTASAAPPAGTAATGGNTVSLPAYGVTNYLPAGVPGVTTPVTTTLPGQGIYLDGKPALLTSPIGVTFN